MSKMAGTKQHVHSFLGDKGLGIQQGTRVWVSLPKLSEMNRLSLKNNRLKLETSWELRTILEESMEYTQMNESIKTGRCEDVTGWI